MAFLRKDGLYGMMRMNLLAEVLVSQVKPQASVIREIRELEVESK